jgi:hypothetical protein
MSGHELHSTDVRNFDNSYNDAHAVGISHFLEIGEFCPNIVEYIAHEDTISWIYVTLISMYFIRL